MYVVVPGTVTYRSLWRGAKRFVFLDGTALEEHTTAVIHLVATEARGGVPHPSGLRVRVFLGCAISQAYAHSSQAALWAGRPTFHYVQLLPEKAAAGHGSRA